MFDQILELVKEHVGSNSQLTAAIPAEQADAVHHEIASQLTNGLANQTATQGGIGGLLSMLKDGIASGGTLTSAIEGGITGSLAGKFGLSPAITGAIAAAIPGILQKFAHKATDPNDSSISVDSITHSISNFTKGGLGGLFK